MSIGEFGFCPNCRRNIHDHPLLECPWCRSRSPRLARRELELPADATPAQIMRAATEYIEGLMARLKSANAVRGAAARQALAGDLVAIAAEAGCRVASIEKWAQGPRELACMNGHVRADFGEVVNGRWVCRECQRPRPKPEPKEKVKRKRPAAIQRKRWQAHEQRLARRKELADAGLLPERLNAPLPPPSGRPAPAQRR